MSNKNGNSANSRPMGGRGPGGGMGRVVEKPKNFKGTWVKLIKYVKAHMPAIIFALICAAIGTVLQIVGPDIIKDLTAEIEVGLYGMAINMDKVVEIAILLVCLYVASAIFSLIESLVLANVTQKVSKRMRGGISSKINNLPLGYFNKVPYGDVLSRITNDVDTIGQTMNQSLSTLVSAVTMFIGAIIMMFVTSWQMALVAIISSLSGFVLMFIIMSISQKYFKQQQAELGSLNGQIEEIYTGHTVVKAYNASKSSKKAFETTNGKLYTSAWKSQFLSGLMMPLMNFIGNFGYVAVCVAGALLVLNGTITFPIIVAFTIYVRLFTQPLSQFAQAANNLQRTAAAGERVFEFLEEKELDDESHKENKLINIRGDIQFKDIKFGYEPGKLVIKGFSVDVKKGQKIAIVGPTGAGKTTIVNLIMRFFELDSGEITIDGIPTTSVPRDNVHEQFCMVLQDSWLFEGTIKENIIYSKPNITDEEVIEACKTVGVHHIIQTLPDGYDTVLNDRASLSEGEKQLLTIARAIIKDSPLLILDEATSSVDTRTERIVQSAMDKLTKGRTSFVIAHRLSTIKNADTILVMNHGDIIESGKHTDLLKKGGFYADLYNSQFELV